MDDNKDSEHGFNRLFGNELLMNLQFSSIAKCEYVERQFIFDILNKFSEQRSSSMRRLYDDYLKKEFEPNSLQEKLRLSETEGRALVDYVKEFDWLPYKFLSYESK
jgi:hypothetical protein